MDPKRKGDSDIATSTEGNNGKRQARRESPGASGTTGLTQELAAVQTSAGSRPSSASSEKLLLDFSKQIWNTGSTKLSIQVTHRGWFSLDGKGKYSLEVQPDLRKFHGKQEVKECPPLLQSSKPRVDMPSTSADLRSTAKRAFEQAESSSQHGAPVRSVQNEFKALRNLRTFAKSMELKEDNYMFVCPGSTLTKVMLTSYDSSWKIMGKKVANTWYLSEHWELMNYTLTRQQYEDSLQRSRAFESFATKSELPFDKKYYRIVDARLGKFSMLLSGEIDCIDASGRCVELKTRLKTENQDLHENRKKRNEQQTWPQSYILGVKTIVTGYYDANNRLTEMDPNDVLLDTPNTSDNYQQLCLDTLFKFLDNLQSFGLFKTDTTYVFSTCKDKKISYKSDDTGADFPPAAH